MDRTEREVLVHISAPSGARDDAQYLSQTETYFTFDAVSRIKIFPGNDDGDTAEDLGYRIFEREEAEKGVESIEVDQGEGLTSDDKLEIAPPPASNPRNRTRSDSITSSILSALGSSGPSERFSTPPLSGERSEKGQQRKDRPLSHKQLFTPENPRIHTLLLSPAPLISSKSNVVPAQSLEEADSPEFPPSVVPDSQPASLSPIEREDSHGPEHGAELLRGWSSEATDVDTSQSIDVLLPPNKRQRLNPPKSQLQLTDSISRPFLNPMATATVARSHDDPLDISIVQHSSFHPSMRSTKSTTDDLRSSTPALLSLEIHPLPPATSNSPFKTHITPTMQMLCGRLHLSRVFNPIWKARDLRSLERGYWSFEVKIVNPEAEERQQECSNDSSVWPLPLFTRFWSFLADFIGKEGRAGWGVWCVREPQNLSLGETDELQWPKTEHVKIYTWGEVVPHIYLLLFLASERRIKGMRAEWKDAKDEVVVLMN